MNNLKRVEEAPFVPQAQLPPDFSLEKMSELGRHLCRISAEIAESDETPLLNENEIEIELTRRRGGC